MIHIRSLTRTYNRDVDYQETGAYGWNDRAGSDEASGSGCSSGSGSGSAEPGWRLTSVTESGLGVGGRTLESSYNGSGSGWAESGDDDEGSESSSQWEAQRWIRQQSTSTRTLAKATSYSQGDQQSMSLDDGSGRSSSHPADNGQDRPADPRGKGPPARDRHHPGRGRSAEHHRSPVWSHWDTLDQLFAVAPPEPAIRYEVDAAGNLLSVTDMLGHQAAYTYDAGGQVTSVTDPNGHTTFFVYDSSGNLTVLTDPLGNQTAWTYDDAGQVTREQVTIDGVVLNRTFDYDDGGNLVRSVDRNGRVRVFVWDDNQRLHQEIWYDTIADADLDADRQNTITWTYDQAGNLASVVDDFSSYVYAYLCPCQLGTGEIFRESQFLAAYGGVCASARDGRWHGGLLDRPMATALC